MTQPSPSEPRAGAALSPAFVRRVLFLVAVGIVLIATWQLLDVLLLAFGAVIVAVVLRSVAEPIEKHTPLSGGLSLAQQQGGELTISKEEGSLSLVE